MSFDVLDKNTRIFGNRLLEASAGTGKTFAIEHLFTRHLLEASLGLEEILVLTFTNAAARDLRSRIRQNLEMALLDLESNVKRLDYLDGEEKEKASKVRKALDNFEKANIFTIHSFCLKMLKEEASLSSSSLGDEKADIFERVLEKIDYFLKEKLSFPKYSPRALEKLFIKGVGQLKSRLLNGFEKEKKGALSFEGYFRAFLKELRSFSTPFEASSILEDFEVLKPYFKKVKGDAGFSLGLFLRSLGKRDISFEDFEFLAEEGLSFIPFLDRGNLKARKVFKEEGRLKFFEKLKPFQEIASQSFSEEALFSFMLGEAQEFLYGELQKEGLQTPDMILKNMLSKLSDAHFLNSVRGRFKAVIVDEFQDTDRVQFDIFKKLFLEKLPLSFYLVGDPKQSIYGFRNADLYTYMEAKRAFSEDAHFKLDGNFRSSPELVFALNRLFSNKAWLKLPKLSLSLFSPPVKAELDLMPLCKEKKGLHFFIIEDGKRKEREELLFSYIASEIKALGTGLKIAILVKDRFESARLKRYLNERSLFPVSFGRGDFREKSYAAFYDLLCAIARPDDASNVKKLLLGPFFACSPNESESLYAEAAGAFFKLRECLDRFGPPFFFRKFLDLNFKGGLTVYEKLALKENEEIFEDLRSFMEELFLKCGSAKFNSKELLSFFEKRASQKRFFCKNLHDEGELEIMTIHHSKGLQFDIVFALGAASESESLDEESEAEKLRLFYVALTRARRRCYVPLILKEKFDRESASPLEFFFEGSLNGYEELKRLKIEELISLEEVKEPRPVFEPPSSNLITPLFAPLQSSSRKMLSFSNLRRKEELSSEEGEGLFPKGKAAGIIIHAILAKIFKSDFKKEYALVASIVEEECRFTLLEGFESEVCEIVKRALFTPLLDFCLYDIDPKKARAEEEFVFKLEGGNLMKGYVDLFFSHKGYYYLLDWKSNFLSGYSYDNLKSAMEENGYLLQGAIYGAAIQKFMEEREDKLKFGGLFFLFLRGLSLHDKSGIFHFFPDPALLKEALCPDF